ncbi:ABC transporter ATP-binding protein [Pseudooceanicola aestuarii]|uniref:ABC transporter ATP-binding protein n=1 Tax=Pseudooceanicola aestuarii TaxID=2697319 RepID=UPI0013D77B30|nr:ABC transporter ATP-binding protein [Pseudooceanicola aestuarii]
MIVLRGLTKIHVLDGRRLVVADSIDTCFPTGVSVGLLGRNGAGKSTLLRLIAGTCAPTSGEVLTSGRVSFPLGLASALHPDLTGVQNVRFVARIYGADSGGMIRFVRDFAELGPKFHLPVRAYSSGMKARLSFGMTMALQFDTYLVDEITAVGDAAFRRKSEAFFQARLKRAGAIVVSHSMEFLRQSCTAGAVLEGGRLTWFDSIEGAIACHQTNMSSPVRLSDSQVS